MKAGLSAWRHGQGWGQTYRTQVVKGLEFRAETTMDAEELLVHNCS